MFTYDILIQRRGDAYPGRHVKTYRSKSVAVKFAKDLSNFPADTIHVCVTCDDGSTILDTREASR